MNEACELPQQRLMQRFPFASLIGLKLESLTPGASRFGLTVDPARHHNPQHVVHGSVLHALADTGMGMALYTLLAEGQWCATVEIKLSHFRPVDAGRLVCDSRLLHQGKTIAHLEARAMLGERLVAAATGTFSVFAKPTRAAAT